MDEKNNSPFHLLTRFGHSFIMILM